MTRRHGRSYGWTDPNVAGDDGYRVAMAQPARTSNGKPEERRWRAHFCQRCGRQRERDEYGCPACNCDVYGPDAPGRVMRPADEVLVPLRGVLGRALELGPKGVALLAGSRGSGKTSLAFTAFEHPVVVTAEMTVERARTYCQRLGVEAARFRVDLDLEAPDLGLGRERAELVVDSLQALGDAVAVLAGVRRWCQETGSRAIVTSQVRKDGQVAGFESIPHDADAVVELRRASSGQRECCVTKSRFGAERSILFDLGGDDQAVNWGARYYSVEGPPYRIVPFPSEKSGLYASFLRAAAKDEDLARRLPSPPVAVAGVDGGALYGGWVEPADGPLRRAYAEESGLSYCSMEDLCPPEAT